VDTLADVPALGAIFRHQLNCPDIRQRREIEALMSIQSGCGYIASVPASPRCPDNGSSVSHIGRYSLGAGDGDRFVLTLGG
jgi:hypothetical protein